ncbi:DUF1971 domain-containing protein [Shewanella sp.]|uniref:DUF1971 domain-containing protein n=1 Tax=Shewanella sp. TaxID=50422 RepID=UPI00356AFE4B
MALVPKHYILVGSTRIFGGNDVPDLLLGQHKTRKGFFSQIEVMEGELLWFGYREHDGEPTIEIRLGASDRAMTHPGKLYRIEPLTQETRFRFNVFAHESLHDVNANADTTVGLFLEGEPSTSDSEVSGGTGYELEAHR